MDALFICTIFHSHKYRLKTFLSELFLVLFWRCLLFLPQLLPPPALVTMRMTVTLTFAISVLFMFIAFIQNCCHCISHTKIQLLPCDSAHILSTRLKGRERISVLLHLNVCHFWLINIFDATLSWHNAWFRLFFAQIFCYVDVSASLSLLCLIFFLFIPLFGINFRRMPFGWFYDGLMALPKCSTACFLQLMTHTHTQTKQFNENDYASWDLAEDKKIDGE